MWKRAAAAMVVAAGIVVTAAAAAANADELCPALDPACLGETVGELDATVEETIGTATDAVDEVVGGAGETADEILGGLLGGGGGPVVVPPDVDGGTDAPGAGGGPGGDGSDRTEPGRTAQAAPRGSTSIEPAALTVVTGGGDGPVRGPIGPAVHGRAGATEAVVSGAALARTAAGIGAIALLLGLALGFASLQHAGDRRDPKLAPAMMASDQVPFA